MNSKNTASASKAASASSNNVAASKLSETEKQAWTTYVDAQHGLLIDALESADRTTLLAFAAEGVSSRLDNKFSTADRKREAVAANEALTLASILPTSRKGEKAALLEAAFDCMTAKPASRASLMVAIASGKVADLKAALEAANASK